MGKFLEIFNFDNIGGKIKGLVKWLCWITIFLIWVIALVRIIFLVSNKYTANRWWVPFVCAIIGSIVVWIGSWTMYAFGELVEKTCDNEYNTRKILEKLTEDDNDSDYTTTEEAYENDLIEDEERKRKIARVVDLRRKGIISEEFYQKAINSPQILDRF